MLSRIKKFFSNEDEEENLLAVNSKDWMDGYKQILDARDDNTQPALIEQINIRVSQLHADADSLLKSDFQNKGLDQRLQNLIEDNRVNYVKRLKELCDAISINTDQGLVNVKSVCLNFSVKMGNFSESTNKTYFALKDAFYTEMSTIVGTIKEINRLYKELSDSTMTGFGKEFEDLKTRTKDYYEHASEEKKLRQSIDESRNEINDSNQRLFDIERKKEILKLSNGFKMISEPYEERENVNKEIKHLKEEIFVTLMHMEDLLKELKKTSMYPKLIDKYLEDPVSALLWDEKLEFNNVLEELKKALDEKKIDVDFKRRQKVLGSIERIEKKSFLNLWINDYKKHQKAKRDIEEKIGRNPTMLDISELDYQISHMAEKIEKRKHVIHIAEDRINEMNLQKEKEGIEADLKKFSGKKIILI